MDVGDEPPKAVAEGEAGRVLQRRASGPAGGKGKQGGYAGEVLQRAASFSHPPPPPEPPVAGVRKAAAVGAPDSSSPIEGMTDEGKGTLETMVPIPEEEQAFVDELLMEVRFPLVSTSFLCQGAVQCCLCQDRRVVVTSRTRRGQLSTTQRSKLLFICHSGRAYREAGGQRRQTAVQERTFDHTLTRPCRILCSPVCSALVRLIFAS